MKIDSITIGMFASNCHIISNEDGECLVVDPGAEADRLDAFITENNLHVAGYLITHGHVDHVSALADLVARHPAWIAMHPADAEWAFDTSGPMTAFFPAPEAPPSIDRDLVDGQQWEDIGLTYSVIETPGHSPGGVCFYFEKEGVLIAGDTLFKGSVGRTDFPGGDSRILGESLKKLCALPNSTIVYSGHGPATTIEEEKQTNYFLKPGALS